MTPDEEQVAALKALLGRIRGNAEGRLAPRVGDEEEFVPRSVREARAAAAAADAAGPAEATEAAAAAAAAAAPDAQADARPAVAPAEHVRGANGAAADHVAVATDSSPPLDLDLPDVFDEDLLDASAEHAPPFDEESFEGPSRQSRVPTAAPSGVIATIPPDPSRADGDDVDGFEGFDDGFGVELDDARDLGPPSSDAPPRQVDPLAVTTQNPVPSISFERAQRGATGHGASDRGVPERGASGELASDDDAPSSSPRPVDPDVVADVGLDSEPPPESGEVASQRADPPSSPHDDLDLDAPTATGESERLARALEDRLRHEAAIEPEHVAAAPPVAPQIVGRRPLVAASFLEVLDAALSFGER